MFICTKSISQIKIISINYIYCIIKYRYFKILKAELDKCCHLPDLKCINRHEVLARLLPEEAKQFIKIKKYGIYFQLVLSEFTSN